MTKVTKLVAVVCLSGQDNSCDKLNLPKSGQVEFLGIQLLKKPFEWVISHRVGSPQRAILESLNNTKTLLLTYFVCVFYKYVRGVFVCTKYIVPN